MKVYLDFLGKVRDIDLCCENLAYGTSGFNYTVFYFDETMEIKRYLIDRRSKFKCPFCGEKIEFIKK